MAKNKNADPFPWLTDKGKQNTGYQKYVPQPQQQQQQQQRQLPTQQANPYTAATAMDEIAAAEKARLAGEKKASDARTEQSRYEDVSKKEGEKRKKEFEERSKVAAGKATGGMRFTQPETISTVSGNSAKSQNLGSSRNTILGLPKETSAFTKFGESINRAANLTFSSPQTRFGGI